MSKQMPEVTAPSRNEQLISLRTQLLGNKYFAACRGKLGSSVVETMNELIGQTPNPSQFNKAWEEFAASATVMGNLLAQYKRDGWSAAHQVLSTALWSPLYLMPEETVPVEQTVPVTLVMPDPKRTMLLLNWLIQDHWSNLNMWLDEKDGRVRDKPLTPEHRVRKLFQEFPTLEKHTRKRWLKGDYEGDDLRNAYVDTVLSQFPQLKSKDNNFVPCSLMYGQWNDHVEIKDQEFTFAVVCKRSEVLKRFSHQQQKALGTWQINVPKALIAVCSKTTRIGFHPEAEHKLWQVENPCFVSESVDCGLGTVAFLGQITATDSSGELITYETNRQTGNPSINRIVFETERDLKI